jgi:hypothetical protein
MGYPSGSTDPPACVVSRTEPQKGMPLAWAPVLCGASWLQLGEATSARWLVWLAENIRYYLLQGDPKHKVSGVTRDASLNFCVCHVVLGVDSGPSPWATPPALFCDGYFRDRVLASYLPGLTLNHNPPDLCLLSS